MSDTLYRSARGRLRLASGRPIEHLSLDRLQAGGLAAADLGIHADTLREQARLAEQAGFVPLARNLERAAELTALPDAKILEIYDCLRRGGPRAALEALASEIEGGYGASRAAAFLREAAAEQP